MSSSRRFGSRAMGERRTTPQKPPATDAAGPLLRIGEAASLCGVTTRTLRYWEEIGLLNPNEQRHGGERLYRGAEVERARRIRELQELLGFSLAEIRVVLETDDLLDKVRSAYKANARAELQQHLLAEALEANDALLARLDDTLTRVKEFRAERAEKAKRMRVRAAELAEPPRP